MSVLYSYKVYLNLLSWTYITFMGKKKGGVISFTLDSILLCIPFCNFLFITSISWSYTNLYIILQKRTETPIQQKSLESMARMAAFLPVKWSIKGFI